MKRLAAVLVLTSAAMVGGIATAGTASADVCVHVNVNINGQGDEQALCVPTAPPALPGL